MVTYKQFEFFFFFSLFAWNNIYSLIMKESDKLNGKIQAKMTCFELNAIGQIQKLILSFNRWNLCRFYFAYNWIK